MPALSPSDATLARSAPPIVRYYLAIVPRRVVFACALDNVGATYGETTLPYDGVTMGLWGDVVVGQTLWVYSSSVVYKDKVRVRAIDASEITVAANYDIEWEDNDLLRVMDIFEPWSVPTGVVDPNGDLIYYKDSDIAWVDNDTAFPPKANDQGSWAGFLGPNGWVDVQFDAVDSVANTDGGSVVSWNRPSAGGAFSSGGVVTEQATIRFSTGAFRWVTLTVTDNNGQTGIHRMPVWTFGGNYQPFTNFEIVRRTKEVRDGELTIEAYDGSITPNDIPEGTRLVLFTVTKIDGTEVTSQMGCPFLGRAHVKFDGYVLKDSVVWDAETGTVTFTVGTLGKIADDMRGFATFIKDVDAGEEDSWHTGSVLTVRNVIFWLLRWHTNLTELAYMEIEPVELIAGRKFPKAPPFKQLEAAMLMTRGVFARLGVSRWHSVHIRYDPQELSTVDRAARATILDLTSFDWFTELSIEKAARPRISSVFGGGIAYDGVDGTPYRARAPGSVGRESGRDIRADNLIISSQNDLNALLGRLLAAESSPWKAPNIELLYDIWEPALQEYLTLVVNANENPRGFSFAANEPWVVRRVEIEDTQGGTPSVKVTPELLVGEFAGVTVAIPDPPGFGDWPTPPPPPPIPPVVPPDIEPEWAIKVFVGTATLLYYTTNFSGPGGAMPDWDDVTGNLLTLSGATGIHRIAVDPIDPLNYWYVMVDHTATNPYGLYKSVNQGAAWTLIMDNTLLPGSNDPRDFCVDRVTGVIYVLYEGSDSDSHLYYSSNYGVGWNDYDTARGWGSRNCDCPYAQDGVVFHNRAHTTSTDVVYKENGTWNHTENAGVSSYARSAAATPRVTQYYLFWGGRSGTPALYRGLFAPDGPDPIELNTPDGNIDFTRIDRIWFHPSTSGSIRIVQSGDWASKLASRIYITVDDGMNWSAAANISENGLAPHIFNIIEMCWKVHDDAPAYIIYGSSGHDETPLSDADVYETGHHVLVADVDKDGINVVYPKAGNNTDTGVDSIIVTAGGVVRDGIQVIE